MLRALGRFEAFLVDRDAALVVLQLGRDHAEVRESESKVRVVLQRPRQGRALLPPVARRLAVLAAVVDAAEKDQEPVALVLVDLPGEKRQRRFGPSARQVEVALAPLERRELAQHLGAQKRRDLPARRRVERPFEPGAAFGEVAAHEPELGSRGGQPHTQLARPGLAREGKGSPEVVVLALECRVDLIDGIRGKSDHELLPQLAEVVRVAAPHLLGLAGLDEPLDGVFANRLEHPVAAVLGAPDETGLGEAGERLGRVFAAHRPHSVAS